MEEQITEGPGAVHWATHSLSMQNTPGGQQHLAKELAEAHECQCTLGGQQNTDSKPQG